MVVQQGCMEENGMISLKDYASQKNVSYEAVRKQVVRYKEDLGAHIVMDGKQQFLDEEAVAFLDDKRKRNPVIVYEAAKDDEIERLKAENRALLLKLTEKQEKIEVLQDRLLELQEAPVLLLTAQNEAAAATAEVEQLRDRLQDAAEENERLRLQISEKEAAPDPVPEVHRWWQFWK